MHVAATYDLFSFSIARWTSVGASTDSPIRRCGVETDMGRGAPVGVCSGRQRVSEDSEMISLTTVHCTCAPPSLCHWQVQLHKPRCMLQRTLLARHGCIDAKRLLVHLEVLVRAWWYACVPFLCGLILPHSLLLQCLDRVRVFFRLRL